MSSVKWNKLWWIEKKLNSVSSSFPIVAASVLRWIEFRIFDPSYFKLDQGTTPVHLIIIDEVNFDFRGFFVFIQRNPNYLDC